MWLCAQIGAREHYAVARALQQQGLLAGLATDWYFFAPSAKKKAEKLNSKTLKADSPTSDLRPLSSVLRCLSFIVRSPSARAARCEGIPDELVHAFPLRSLFWKWRVRRLAARGRGHEAFLETDAAFAAAVARLKLPPHEVFFGYSYASLEMLEAEKKRGVLTVLDQIDPGAVEFRLVAEEMKQHPEIAGPAPDFPIAYYERNRREWELADIIIVNSEWSRQALNSEGADAAKIEVLPLAYEAPQHETTRLRDQETKGQGQKMEDGRWKMESSKTRHTSPQPSPQGGEGADLRSPTSCPPSSIFHLPSSSTLRVLWLGQVNVRKGIHYLMAAARLLEGENIQFDVVGPIGILPGAVAAAPRNMTFHGPVNRDRAAEWYRQSDVFVLPTVSDGFALTQLEAMAHGLPVITTPNCGRVVEPGKTGFIVPARDARALGDAILKFAGDRNLSVAMAPACREAVEAFSVEAYGKGLVDIVRRKGNLGPET